MAKTKAKSVRRTYRKKYARRAKKAVINNTMVTLGKGFPKRMCFTHKYVEVVVRNPVTTMNNYLYSCNGMYDPNITGTGHQPMYFDQLTALYNHYTVIGSKISFKIIPTTAASSAIFYCVSINDDSTVTPTSIQDMQEASSGKGTIIPAGSNNVSYASLTWSAKKNWGKSLLSNTLFRGNSSANPSEQQYFVLSVGSLDGVTSTPIYFEVVIEYIAVWQELKDIASS